MSILLTLIGIVLVIVSRETFGVAYWVSLLLVMLTPVIWAVNNIITKDIVKRHSPIVMVAASFVFSSLFLIPIRGFGWHYDVEDFLVRAEGGCPPA